MVIFINGSFGVGKTTVARLLQERLPRSVVFDPEPMGLVLLHLSRPWPPSAGVDDFQRLAVWRAASLRAIGLLRHARPIVIVPMAFSNVVYLRLFLSHTHARDDATFHYCLTAPLAVVRERLTAREGARGPTDWQLRRSAECCAAHQGPAFTEQIATENRSAQQVAEEILLRLRQRL